ncbi:MAG: hypothetical protein A2W91_14555 [Bacteroidetes bacterium GWF2_38_335]|nr:MAG: hypothetical protein A2W91_14555 [Bacteroidetes bacterium GWF2_38_335]OFY79321.1 MAG: hypothetical protein A2281_16600 [Bacteroidetes bacterium RIFOXYA12_FULL_38_20]HBS85578.1 hypothetical protein [Bacteroidales bacterium]
MTTGSDKNNSGKSLLIILLFVFIINSIVAWYMYYMELQNKQETIVQVETIASEKEELKQEYEDLLGAYDKLIAENGAVKDELGAEKSRVEELLEELKTTKSSNYARIKELKTELETMRSILQSFVRQIDSLNTINQELTAENIKVITENIEMKSKNESLTTEKNKLTEQVEVAKVVKARSIQVVPMNEKGKERDKADKVARIKISMILSENDLIDPGSRNVYIRIARPDQIVLATNEDDLFSYGGSKIIYSEKKQVDYQGKDTDFFLFWNKDQELIPGTYHLDIFMDGSLIGNATFSLK